MFLHVCGIFIQPLILFFNDKLLYSLLFILKNETSFYELLLT